MLARLKPIDKGIKIVLKGDEGLLEAVIEVLLETHIQSDKLWFDIIFEVFYEEGLKHILDCFPQTIISTRIDFLAPLLSQFPMYVADILDKLSNQGINHYSISLIHIIIKRDSWRKWMNGDSMLISEIFTLLRSSSVDFILTNLYCLNIRF